MDQIAWIGLKGTVDDRANPERAARNRSTSLLAELDRLIDGDRYFLSPRIKALREIRAALKPTLPSRQATPVPRIYAPPTGGRSTAGGDDKAPTEATVDARRRRGGVALSPHLNHRRHHGTWAAPLRASISRRRSSASRRRSSSS